MSRTLTDRETGGEAPGRGQEVGKQQVELHTVNNRGEDDGISQPEERGGRRENAGRVPCKQGEVGNTA